MKRRKAPQGQVLKPHKEQDGWKYVRVKAHGVGLQPLRISFDSDLPPNVNVEFGYCDSTPGSRIISSRRVERAVENDDYLRKCAEEGLCVTVGHHGSTEKSRFSVFSSERGPCFGATLREAYHRFHALDAMRPDEQ